MLDVPENLCVPLLTFTPPNAAAADILLTPSPPKKNRSARRRRRSKSPGAPPPIYWRRRRALCQSQCVKHRVVKPFTIWHPSCMCLSSAVSWPANTGNAYKILDVIRPNWSELTTPSVNIILFECFEYNDAFSNRNGVCVSHCQYFLHVKLGAVKLVIRFFIKRT